MAFTLILNLSSQRQLNVHLVLDSRPHCIQGCSPVPCKPFNHNSYTAANILQLALLKCVQYIDVEDVCLQELNLILSRLSHLLGLLQCIPLWQQNWHSNFWVMTSYIRLNKYKEYRQLIPLSCPNSAKNYQSSRICNLTLQLMQLTQSAKGRAQRY